MNRSGFIPGVAVAFALALAAALFAAAPMSPFSSSDVGFFLPPALSGLYLAWLLRHRRSNVGKATAVLAWMVCAGGGWLLVRDMTIYGVIHVTFVAVVRAVFYGRGALAAAGELLLSAAAGIAAAIALTRTGSVFLGVWTFFLMQAASAFIPDSCGRQSARSRDQSHPAFLRAEQQAEAALERLIER